jgi:hypothetical protein
VCGSPVRVYYSVWCYRAVLFSGYECNIYGRAELCGEIIDLVACNVALGRLAGHEIIIAFFPCQLGQVGDLYIYTLAVLATEERIVLDRCNG